MTSCWSSRKAVFRAQASQRLEVRDTLREQVMVTVTDTLREVTTITVRESETGDTLRMTTVTDRTRASTCDRYHDIQEEVIVRTDTVFVEQQTDKRVAIVGPNIEIDEQGNVTKKVNHLAQSLKWLFLTIVAIIVLIVVIRLKVLK